MKLIDILVEELPKSGGWLSDVKTMTQDRGGNIWGYDCVSPCLKGGLWSSISGDDLVRNSKIEARNLAVDWNTAIITREQYEAALAEKEHPLPWEEKNKPCPTLVAECRGCHDCGRRVSCTSDDITDDAVRAEMWMNSRTLDAALAAKNDGWIEWGGGKHPPVSINTVVDVKLEKGYVQSGYTAGEYSWEHIWQGSNIIAYRLHQPKKSEQVRADAWNAYAGITEPDAESDLNECIGKDAAQVWGGEGKPAIGEKCEHHSGGQWEAVTIAGIYENLVTGFTDYWMVKEDGSSYTVGNPYRFRPIRSEADKKREEAIKDMTLTGWCESAAEEMYDLIAEGKVRGVKLEV